MIEVLNNIVEAWRVAQRDIFLVYVGSNNESIGRFQATGFDCQEILLRPDWQLLAQYRCLVCRSPSDRQG